KLALNDDSDRPKEKGSDSLAPPRQAYSHSASVGSRYTRPASRSLGRADNFAHNSWASSQDTFSTGWSGPPPLPAVKFEGLLPITCAYSACVASRLPIRN